MAPLRLLTAGVVLVLVAVVLFLVVGYLAEADPFTNFYFFEWLMFLQFFIGSLGGAGIFLILRGVWIAQKKDLPPRPLPRIFPEMRLRNLTTWKGRTISPALVMGILNAFSVSWICVLMTLVTIFMIVGPLPPKGLRIDWRERSHIKATESPWPETMSVYIARDGRFYVNGIATQELETKLREELSRRAEWTVYLEADDYTSFMYTVYAIDTIQRLGAKVFWVTPRTRAEWNKERGSSGFPESHVTFS